MGVGPKGVRPPNDSRFGLEWDGVGSWSGSVYTGGGVYGTKEGVT